MVSRKWVTAGGQVFKRLPSQSGIGEGTPAVVNPFADPDTVTGLVLRLRASDEVYKDAGITLSEDGDIVGQWIDITANVKEFSQTTTAKKPILQTDEINGKPIVRFDGVDDLLKLPEEYLTSTSGSIFIVYKLNTSVKSAQRLLSSSDEPTANYKQWITGYDSVSSPKFGLLHREAGGANTVIEQTTGQVSETGGTNLIAVESSGIAYGLRLNGADEGVSVVLGDDDGDWFGDTSLRDHVMIGANDAGGESSHFKGDIAEILVYDNKVSSGDRDIIEGYLGFEYGVTLP